MRSAGRGVQAGWKKGGEWPLAEIALGERVARPRKSRKGTGQAGGRENLRSFCLGGRFAARLKPCPDERDREIPPPRRSARGAQIALRGPTRHNSARKRKSGRFGPFDFAQGRRDHGRERQGKPKNRSEDRPLHKTGNGPSSRKRWTQTSRLPPAAGRQKDGPYIRRRKAARPPENGGHKLCVLQKTADATSANCRSERNSISYAAFIRGRGCSFWRRSP